MEYMLAVKTLTVICFVILHEIDFDAIKQVIRLFKIYTFSFLFFFRGNRDKDGLTEKHVHS